MFNEMALVTIAPKNQIRYFNIGKVDSGTGHPGNQHRTERVNFEGKKRVGEMREEATREANSIFTVVILISSFSST